MKIWKLRGENWACERRCCAASTAAVMVMRDGASGAGGIEGYGSLSSALRASSSARTFIWFLGKDSGIVVVFFKFFLDFRCVVAVWLLGAK